MHKLIATRVSPGDRWILVGTEDIIEGLVPTLNEFMSTTGYRGDYVLSPLNGTIHIIEEDDEDIIVKNPSREKRFNIYGN